MTDNKLDKLIEEYTHDIINNHMNAEGNVENRRIFKQAIIDYVLDDKSELVRRNNELEHIAHDLECKLQKVIRIIKEEM